jgi:putative transposase
MRAASLLGRPRRVRNPLHLAVAAAYATHPERFVGRPPEPPEIPSASWINPPQNTEAITR